MLSSSRSWGALMLGGGARADILCYVITTKLLLCSRLLSLSVCLHFEYKVVILNKKKWTEPSEAAAAVKVGALTL